MDKFINNILDISQNYYKYLINLENVNGVGVGYKYINNINILEPCIHVLVEKKVDKNYLSKNNLVPKTYMGVKTDIIEVGETQTLSSGALPQKFRPLKGGASISSVASSETGTLGCIVKKAKLDYFQYFILTNNHVVTDLNKTPIGTPIIQPGFICGGSFPEDTIGRLKDFVPIKFIDDGNGTIPENYVDAAIVKIYNKALISDEIHVIGNLKGINTAKLNETVVKVGFMTAQSLGKIDTLGLTQTINIASKKLALFKNQIRAKLTLNAGDSGSIVINNNDEAVGLLFAGNFEKRQAYINDINTVLSKFNVEIYTK